MREGERLKKRDREREKGSETDVPKLYPTMNMNSLCTLEPNHGVRLDRS